MHSVFETAPATSAIPITFATKATWEAIRAGLPAPARQFALSQRLCGKARRMPDPARAPTARSRRSSSAWRTRPANPATRSGPAQLPGLLPPGVYRFANAPHDTRLATLAFALGSYRFGRYRKADAPDVRLVPPDGIDVADIARMAEAAALARDLINTPANDMGPEELAQAAQELAKRFGASFNCIVGDDLTRQNFPLIHAVGMASPRAPRLIDLDLGRSRPSQGDAGRQGRLLRHRRARSEAVQRHADHEEGHGRRRQRAGAGADGDGRQAQGAAAGSDSGGRERGRRQRLPPARHLPLAQGLTVEIGNTDAEGRLVLADALALADEEKPDLLIDLGTLTGAARVALGPDLPPFYTNDETLAQDVARCAKEENDPLWRLPLWPAYDSWLDSKVANINNAPSGGFAGSITCALFLQRFVEAAKSWLHVDIYGWTPSAKPARPEGGECQAARAIYKLLSERYG